MGAAGGGLMHSATLTAELARLERELDTLAFTAAHASGEAAELHYRAMDDLQDRIETLRDALTDMEGASND